MRPVPLLGGAWAALLAIGVGDNPPKPVVSELRVGHFVVKLETASFEDVAAVLGDSPRTRSGDAGNALVRVCYRLSAGAGPATMELLSSEIGGGRYIDGFRLSEGQNPGTCAVIPTTPQLVRTERGIGLGLSPDSITHLMGAAGRDSAGFVWWEAVTPDSAVKDAATLSTLSIRYRGRRAVVIEGWHVTTS